MHPSASSSSSGGRSSSWSLEECSSFVLSSSSGAVAHANSAPRRRQLLHRRRWRRKGSDRRLARCLEERSVVRMTLRAASRLVAVVADGVATLSITMEPPSIIPTRTGMLPPSIAAVIAPETASWSNSTQPQDDPASPPRSLNSNPAAGNRTHSQSVLMVVLQCTRKRQARRTPRPNPGYLSRTTSLHDSV